MPKSKKNAKKQKKSVAKEVAKDLVSKGTPKSSVRGAGGARMQLANSSYYLKSMMDPFNFPGSKIPDQVTLPSATTQCVYRFQLTVNAGGLAGVWVTFGNVSSSAGIQTSAAGSVPAVMTWNAAGAKSYAAGLQAVASNKRLVSGYISYEYQGAPLNRKGRATLDLEGIATNFGTAPTDISLVLVRPYAEDLNVADSPFGMVRYVPQDTTALSYTLTTASSTYGYGGIILDGCVVGDIIEFTVVENFEFIPLSNTVSLISPTPSISDPIEMSVAANAVTLDAHFPTNQPKADPARGKIGVQNMKVHGAEFSPHNGSNPTMMEKILSGISRALPVVKGVAEAGINLLPLLL